MPVSLRSLIPVAAVVAAAVVTGAPPLASPAQGQTVEGRAGSFRVGGRLHTQIASTSIEGTPEDFFIRRARATIDVTILDGVQARLMPDFAGGSTELHDAWVRLDFDPWFRFHMGQLKRAFDHYELESSTQLPLVERDGRMPGLDTCAGVGGTCSFSRMTEQLGFAGRDVGLAVDGSNGTVGYHVTLTNGTGINQTDENSGKSLSGRVEVALDPRWTVAGHLGLHDYVAPGGDTEYAPAIGADVVFGDYGGGPLVTAGLATGDNWAARELGGDAPPFAVAQIVASYYHPVSGGGLVAGIEPVARVSIADPNRDVDDDGGILVTPGVFLYVHGRNRVGANFDVYSPSSGDTEMSFKVMTFVYF